MTWRLSGAGHPVCLTPRLFSRALSAAAQRPAPARLSRRTRLIVGGCGVQDDMSDRALVDRATLIRSAIGVWRDGLINLTGSNRLLNFKASKTGVVTITRPSAA